MLAKEGIVTIKVVKIVFKLFACLISLRTLPILNILIIVAEAPTLVCAYYVTII